MPLVAILASRLIVGVIALVCKGSTMLFYADRYLTAERTSSATPEVQTRGQGVLW